MERVVGVLVGILAGLLVGLVTVLLGTVGGNAPPGAPGPGRCVGLMVSPLLVGALCGGWVSWLLGRNRPPQRPWPDRRQR